MYQFEEAYVLNAEVPDAKATKIFCCAAPFPGYQAFSRGGVCLTRPHESPPSFVNLFDGSWGDAKSRHGVDKLAVKH
jgi:hypothetical protein